MASPIAVRKKIPVAIIVPTVAFVGALLAGFIYLNKPVQLSAPAGPSPEATAYLPNLALSEVDMKATENFMKQQVVEIVGKITNNGPRPIQRIDVYCIFRGVDGREIYRERVPVFQTAAHGPMQPKQTQSFRLPFDTLPEAWNQAMPNLVIAQIVFSQ